MTANNLSREDKIRALSAIKQGKAIIEVLEPNRVLIFFQMSQDPATYECDGRIYTQVEVDLKCRALNKIGQRFIVWGEEKDYVGGPKPTLIINKQEGSQELTVIALPPNGREAL